MDKKGVFHINQIKDQEISCYSICMEETSMVDIWGNNMKGIHYLHITALHSFNMLNPMRILTRLDFFLISFGYQV